MVRCEGHCEGHCVGHCLALVAWDDARDVFTLPPDAVRLLVACNEPRAVLLLPAVIALAT